MVPVIIPYFPCSANFNHLRICVFFVFFHCNLASGLSLGFWCTALIFLSSAIVYLDSLVQMFVELLIFSLLSISIALLNTSFVIVQQLWFPNHIFSVSANPPLYLDGMQCILKNWEHTGNPQFWGTGWVTQRGSIPKSRKAWRTFPLSKGQSYIGASSPLTGIGLSINAQ